MPSSSSTARTVSPLPFPFLSRAASRPSRTQSTPRLRPPTVIDLTGDDDQASKQPIQIKSPSLPSPQVSSPNPPPLDSPSPLPPPGRPAPSSSPRFPSPAHLINRYRHDSSAPRIPSVGTPQEDDQDWPTSDVEADIVELERHVQVTDRDDRPQRTPQSHRRWRPREVDFLLAQVDLHGPAWNLIWQNNRHMQPPPIHLHRSPVNYKDKAMNYRVQMFKLVFLQSSAGVRRNYTLTGSPVFLNTRRRLPLPDAWRQVPVRQRSRREVAVYRRRSALWADQPRLAEHQPVILRNQPLRNLRMGSNRHLPPNGPVPRRR